MEDKLLRMCNSCLKIDVSLGKTEKGNWMPRENDPELYDIFLEKFQGKVTSALCCKECYSNWIKLSKKEQDDLDKERDRRLSY